jgi:hypothetical protein
LLDSIKASNVLVAVSRANPNAPVVVGAAVFQLHLCNNDQYCVTLQLLAAKGGFHAGTKLLNALKALACCSRMGSGYIVAYTLKSAEWFYKHQLPQLHSPMVMAMLLSQHCLDPKANPITPGYMLRGDVVFSVPE